MARDTNDTTPITSRDELVAWFEAGIKPAVQFRIGTEHEKVPFYRADLAPVPYEGSGAREGGIRALLDGMERRTGWERIEDDGKPIGLANDGAGGAISLEPGGQFELSGAPLETLHETQAETESHLADLKQVADPLGIGFLALGSSPKWSLAATPVMPKSRYKIMAGYMPKVGTRGLDMMFRTSTVQVNLDFTSESDMVRKLRVALALQPVATALFANSPFTDGPAERLSVERPLPHLARHGSCADRACCPLRSNPGWASSGTSTTRSMCRCISSSAASTYHDVTGQAVSAISWSASSTRMPGERRHAVGLGQSPVDHLSRGAG